ncbi:MAG: histidinol-phosphatase [Muribaculaceae bacterium]|nr:histidinol-phosphatase [Muribaculaceae bacterium]
MSLNIREITSATNNYNFHTHTQFCDGRATMEAFVIEARQIGYKHLGFSPHSPITFVTTCNMTKESVAFYFREIERLRERYGDINLYASMEIDYIDEWGPWNEYFQHLPLDYRIGSVHFLRSFVDKDQYIDIDGRPEHFVEKMHTYFKRDIKGVIESFYDQSHMMVEKGGFDIIGHFDKIGFNAEAFSPGVTSAPWYDRLVTNLAKSIVEHRHIVEINTKSWLPRQRFFPHLKYFGLLKELGAQVVFNSDCHVPALLSAGRDEAIKMYSE